MLQNFADDSVLTPTPLVVCMRFDLPGYPTLQLTQELCKYAVCFLYRDHEKIFCCPVAALFLWRFFGEIFQGKKRYVKTFWQADSLLCLVRLCKKVKCVF